MIVPLQIKIEKVSAPEDFAVEQVAPSILPVTDPPVYRIMAVVLDTDDREMRSYEFHTCVDTSPGRDPWEGVGRVVFSTVEESREYITALRDGLNGVLGDA